MLIRRAVFILSALALFALPAANMVQAGPAEGNARICHVNRDHYPIGRILEVSYEEAHWHIDNHDHDCKDFRPSSAIERGCHCVLED